MRASSASVVLGLLITASVATVVFEDDFENGLGKWTGKTSRNGAHYGEIVDDPLRPGKAVRFTQLQGGGDIYTVAALSSPTRTFTVYFDYLGDPSQGGVPGELGGLIGYSFDFPGGHTWLDGTITAYEHDNLVDDGQWHRYAYTISSERCVHSCPSPLPDGIHLMIEDHKNPARDAYFDNIVITTSEPLPPTITDPLAGAELVFEDTFDSGSLAKWTGKASLNGAHSAEIVDDPKRPGKAVRFSQLVTGGDIFTTEIFSSPSETFILSFDYLGDPSKGGAANNLGAFVGYSYGRPGGHTWIDGTSSSGVEENGNFVDNGEWQHYSYVIRSTYCKNGCPTADTEPTPNPNGIRLMLEDALGVPRDAYFDNVRLHRTVVHRHQGILFQDDFENGLGKWTGKTSRNGAHYAEIVDDPLRPGKAVRFTQQQGGGDIYTVAALSSPTRTFTMYFDYLGDPSLGGTPGNLGGLIGYSYEFPGGHTWVDGTENEYEHGNLVDDGQWHRYAYTISSERCVHSCANPVTAGIHIMLEDYKGIGRDAYFDNIVVTTSDPLPPTIPNPLGGVNTIFEENFDSGSLAQWTGKASLGGAHSAEIVDDPKRPGKAVRFTKTIFGGDIFTQVAFQSSTSDRFILSFDYLGDPRSQHDPADLGGFIGYAYDRPGGHTWVDGTRWPGAEEHGNFVDDGEWHHYAFVVQGGHCIHGCPTTPNNAIRVMLEDASGPDGSRDAYFDNIRLTDITSVPATPFPPNTQTCASSCLKGVCPAGTVQEITVVGASGDAVWGTGVYSDDSDVGIAAVHAGQVNVGQTKTLPVRCTGAQTSFTGSLQNGVTTQSFNSNYPASFSFDLDGATVAPANPAPEICYSEPCLLNKCQVQSQTKSMVVVGTTSQNIWGSSPYTDDTHLGTAAVHSGILSVGQQGAVTATCSGAQEAFTSSEAFGVTSQSYGFWQFSYTLVQGPPTPTAPANVCEGACLIGKCPAGSTVTVRVFGTTYGYLWGSGTYTDDSHVSLAAVHAGLVSVGETKDITATCGGPQASYTGTTAHGITSASYGPWGASFVLGTAAPATPTECVGSCLHNKCAVTGQRSDLTVTGATSGDVWGSAVYSDDSNVQVAAVHAGVVASGETKVVTAICSGSQTSFTGSTANGATTQDYLQPWPFTFKFV